MKLRLLTRILLAGFVFSIINFSPKLYAAVCLEKLKKEFKVVKALEVATRERAQEIVAEARASDSDIFLFRGVAPSEAKAALENAGTDGRVSGLQRYGVADKSKVAYVMSNTAEMGKATNRQSYDIYKDFQYYGNGGAALEASKAQLGTDYGGDISLVSSIFPRERGFILVYKLTANTKLEAHPESSATVNRRVVAVPQDIKPYAVLPMPESIDEDSGLPQY